MNTSSTQKTDQTNAPSAFQQSYLTDAFNKAQGQSNNAYTGDRVAQFNPDQLNTFRQMLGYANGSSVPGQTAAAGADLTGVGTNAISGAIGRLNGFTPQGGTASNIAAANEYANAAASPEAVQAAMRDATRQVSEQALPQIARQSANSGNAMSSRRAISEGIVQRGLADKTADTSATMRANAFQNGLNLAEQNSQATNNSMLDAIKSAGAMGGSAATTGLGALDSSVNQQGRLFDLAQQGGAGQQAAGQAAIDNKTQMSDAAWDNLMKYYGIVGSQQWGGTQSGTTTSTPSIWQIAGGLMSSAGSLMKSDRRVKHDIYQIGEAPNGLPIYSFRYNGDLTNHVHIGLMAQDVELVKPEAVVTIDGVKHVNYELALAE
jgi:hypothetical protein